MAVRVTIDTRALDAKAGRALVVTARSLGERTDRLMGARVWAWPGRTVRHDDSVADTRRNIVDTGALRDGRTAPRRLAQLSARLTWNSDYAAAVFLGAVFTKREYSMPGRNAPLMAARNGATLRDFQKAWEGA